MVNIYQKPDDGPFDGPVTTRQIRKMKKIEPVLPMQSGYVLDHYKHNGFLFNLPLGRYLIVGFFCWKILTRLFRWHVLRHQWNLTHQNRLNSWLERWAPILTYALLPLEFFLWRQIYFISFILLFQRGVFMNNRDRICPYLTGNRFLCNGSDGIWDSTFCNSDRVVLEHHLQEAIQNRVGNPHCPDQIVYDFVDFSTCFGFPNWILMS